MSELVIYNSFKLILSKSKSIKRFVLADGYGNDLNTNNAGEILEDVLGGIKDGIKYPICIMFPPIEIPNYDTNWSKFKCKLFFLKPIDNELKKNNIKLNVSKRTVKDVFTQMAISAKDFRIVFIKITELSTSIRDGQGFDVIERVSNVGNDKLAGVGISFDIDLFNSCELQDYNENDVEYLIQSL